MIGQSLASHQRLDQAQPITIFKVDVRPVFGARKTGRETIDRAREKTLVDRPAGRLVIFRH